jgi:hypothetical protein
MFVHGGPFLRDDRALVKTVATLSGLTCNQANNSAYYSTYKVLAKKHNLPECVDLHCFSCASIDSDVQRRKPEPLGTYEFILLFIPHYRTGHSPADSQGIGHLQSKLSFMRRADL